MQDSPDYHNHSTAYFKAIRIFFFLVVIFLGSFYLLSSVLLPIIISFTLYALLKPLTNYLLRKKLNHSLAIILILILMLSISILIISFALPQLFAQVGVLKNKIPLMVEKLEQLGNLASTSLQESMGIELEVSEILVSILSQSTSVGNTLLVNISGHVMGITLGMVLVPILTYFILKDYRTLRNHVLNWLPNSSFELGWIIYHRVSRQLEIYTRGVMLQSLIMGLVACSGFLIIGIDMPLMLGGITGLLNLVPYVGPLISMAIAFLVATTMTPFDPSMLYLSVIVVLIAQAVDNFVVIPSLIANSVNLHPVPVIVGVIIFGSLFGTIGVILAIPVMAAARIIFSNLHTYMYNISRPQDLVMMQEHTDDSD